VTLPSTRLLYSGLVLLVASERLIELVISGRHVRLLLARGGYEVDPDQYPVMVTFHTLFLAACPAEVFLAGRPFLPPLGGPMLALLAAATALRWWATRTLGERWSTRVVVVPGAPPVTGGPYALVRHPNYLALVAEVLALPLVHTAWVTALAGTALNAALLRRRIRVEEEALAAAGGYREAFGETPRFVPGRRRGE